MPGTFDDPIYPNLDTSPLPPAMPAGRMLAQIKARRAAREYRERAAELAAMDATRRAIVNTAPAVRYRRWGDA